MRFLLQIYEAGVAATAWERADSLDALIASRVGKETRGVIANEHGLVLARKGKFVARYQKAATVDYIDVPEFLKPKQEA